MYVFILQVHVWIKVSVVDFPASDNGRLQELTVEVTSCASHFKEHICIEGDGAIYTHIDEGHLKILLQIQHIFSRTYQLWILESFEFVRRFLACALMHHPSVAFVLRHMHVHNVNKSEYLTWNPMSQQ